MNKLPQELLNIIYRFNSHPVADIMKDLQQHAKEFYDYGEVDFVESLNLHILKPRAEYPYHHEHDKYKAFIKPDDARAYALYPRSYREVLRSRAYVAANPEYTDSDSDTDSDSESSSSSDSDTPITAVSRRDPSIRVEVRRL